MNTTKSQAPTGRERIERNIVRDRKTGHYLVTLYSGYNAKGAIRSSKTYSTLAEAREAKKKHEYEHRYLGKRSSNTQITVAQCIEQYIAEKNLAETTKDNYRTRLKRIANHPLGKKKLVSVKVIDIERYMDEIEREGLLNSRSINGDRDFEHVTMYFETDGKTVVGGVYNTRTKERETRCVIATEIGEGKAYDWLCYSYNADTLNEIIGAIQNAPQRAK